MNAIKPTETDNNYRRRFLHMAPVVSLIILAVSIGGLITMKQPAFAYNDVETGPVVADEGRMPALGGAVGWLNSTPLDRNSLRPLPYGKHWAGKYKGAGLVVVGAHTPEFSFEKEPANVANAVRDLQVAYPVAIDSDYKIWNAFHNEYWPAQYLIDGKGEIRYHHFGEGDYDEMEGVIQELLKQNEAAAVEARIAYISAAGVEAAPGSDVESSETYIGYARAQHFASTGGLSEDSEESYKLPASLYLNYWGLEGSWKVGGESAVLQVAPGKIAFRFHSRDLHLVLSPPKNGRPIRFKVTLDDVAPGDNCGADCSPDGTGEVREPRLYQLIRQKDQIQDRTFEIEFLDPDVQALDFTFG